MTVRSDLPEVLHPIYNEVLAGSYEEPDIGELENAWAAHVSQARRDLSDLTVEGEGEILTLGSLSPGCEACKRGTWDCIFLLMRCNLKCRFCFSPHAIPDDFTGSVYGATPETITQAHEHIQIDGISFSGGEVFTDMPKLVEWLSWFKDRYPDKYYWVYTNGLLATPDRLRQLADIGLDEIRFNMAATGYDHPRVMAHLRSAVRYIPNVTIEIPAIPEHADKLLACLPRWAEIGVRFLNLHELIYEPGSNSDSMPGARWQVTMPDGHHTAIHPESRALTLKVMKRVQADGLSLSVNDCSLQSKLRQIQGRRRNVAALAKAPYEKLVDDIRYESYCAFHADEVYFIHPDSFAEARRKFAEFQFVLLGRTAPLSPDDRGQWIMFTDV